MKVVGMQAFENCLFFFETIPTYVMIYLSYKKSGGMRSLKYPDGRRRRLVMVKNFIDLFCPNTYQLKSA